MEAFFMNFLFYLMTNFSLKILLSEQISNKYKPELKFDVFNFTVFEFTGNLKICFPDWSNILIKLILKA